MKFLNCQLYSVPLMQVQTRNQRRTVNMICDHLELEELVAVVTPEVSPSLPPRDPWPLPMDYGDYIDPSPRLRE